MTTKPPHLIVVGGPNGSGKTTITRELQQIHGLPYFGADDIAEELAPGDWERVRVRVPAGRLWGQRVRACIGQGGSLLVESTLSGRTLLGLIEQARGAGYQVSVVLVFLESAEHCVARVQERIAKGGHPVPEADIRRRYRRSLANFWNLYRPRVDRWQLFCNSGDVPLEVAMGMVGVTEVFDETLFTLFQRLIGGADEHGSADP